MASPSDRHAGLRRLLVITAVAGIFQDILLIPWKYSRPSPQLFFGALAVGFALALLAVAVVPRMMRVLARVLASWRQHRETAADDSPTSTNERLE